MSAANAAWWGFHQLRDSHARSLVRRAGIGSGDLVVDIGAGTGAITRHLLAAGATVIAVELHPKRATFLRQRFSGKACVVVMTDATDLRLPRRPFRVVSNLPFAAATGVLRRLTSPGSRLVRADLVVPGYIARRWSSARAPGARRWRATFDVRATGRLPPSAFIPPSTVATAVVVIERRAERRAWDSNPR